MLLTENIETNTCVERQQDLGSPIPSCSKSPWKTPISRNVRYYQEKEHEGYKIPTPFKKCLVFPKTPEKKTPKRKRTIFPYVVSSGKYREYYENEVKKKNVPKRKKK